MTFWPRATLRGPKRSFVIVGVVIYVAGVEKWVKNVQNGKKCAREQKNVQENKKCAGNKKRALETKNVPLSKNEVYK